MTFFFQSIIFHLPIKQGVQTDGHWIKVGFLIFWTIRYFINFSQLFITGRIDIKMGISSFPLKNQEFLWHRTYIPAGQQLVQGELREPLLAHHSPHCSPNTFICTPPGLSSCLYYLPVLGGTACLFLWRPCPLMKSLSCLELPDWLILLNSWNPLESCALLVLKLIMSWAVSNGFTNIT